MAYYSSPWPRLIVDNLRYIVVGKFRIRTVFNKVEVDDLVADEFSSLIGLAEQENAFTLNPDAVIYVNEVFEKLKAVGKSLGDIANGYDRLPGQTEKNERRRGKEHCVRMVALKRLGITANKNLEDAFKAIFQ